MFYIFEGKPPLYIGKLLENISVFSHLLPLLVFFLFLKRNKLIRVKVLLFYIVISFINDNLLLIFNSSRYDRLTYVILSTYTIFEYSIFTYFLYSIIDNKIFKSIVAACTLGFFLFALITFFFSKQNDFDSLSASIESILIIAFCIFYLFDQLNKPQVMFIYQDPNFWFVVGFMVYLAGTLFLFIEANDLAKPIRDNFWKILLFANITKNILFAIAFSTKKSKPLQDSIGNPFDDNILDHI